MTAYSHTDIAAGAAANAATFNAPFGQLDEAINTSHVCEGRLTLQSGVPVSVSGQSAKATVYFTPYCGDRISLYDGSYWKLFTFTEKSVAVPATTVTPFDVFMYDNAGTLTLEALSWTNDTTRATALVLQNGVLVKTGATTRRYLGTCRTTAANGQTEDTQTKRFVWNYYNRVNREATLSDATQHTYATAAWRYWNNGSTNLVEFVIGYQEDLTIGMLNGHMVSGVGAGRLGIGLDTTASGLYYSMVIDDTNTMGAAIVKTGLLLGYHYMAVIQYVDANTTTYYSYVIEVAIRG